MGLYGFFKITISPLQKTRGPLVTLLTLETVPIKKHIYTNLCLSHSLIKKKICPFKKFNVLICKNLSLLHPKVLGALLWVWLNLALWFWTTRSLIFVNVFHYFIIVSPWDRVWPFNWTNLNPLQPRILCTKLGWNWTSGSGEYVNVKSLQTLSIRGGYCGTNLTMLDFEKKSKNFLDDLCIFQTYVI